MGLYTFSGVNLNYGMKTYNCQDYGVVPSSSDNADALNDLITLVSENGGGVIWVPIGTYLFDSSKHYGSNMVEPKSNVSIIGESMTGSIFKVVGNTQRGKLFFQYEGDTNTPITGCTYANMTYDASEATVDSYSYLGKGFMYSYVKDCVWKDLKLIGFPATALGIDLLDNVVIDSVYVYQGGREWAYGGTGGAGIGIGTGTSGWEHENFIIRNCICDSCGHYGIFLEDQGMFRSPATKNYPKGQIITNNIVHGGKHYGIGVRGGRYVSITGNNIYSNTNGGVYLDYGADQVMISNNLISGETNAVCFGNENAVACTKIAVINNVFSGCTNGIVQQVAPTGSVLENNVTL